MTHTEMDDLYELYVLGALEPELAAEIEQHLLEQCSYCLEHVPEATQLTAAMAGIAAPVTPGAHLRERVLASVTPRPATVVPQLPRRPVSWIWAAAALAAACIALAVYALGARSELQQMGGRLQAAVNERDQTRSALANAQSAERAQVVALTSERDQLRSALASANSAAQLQVAALKGERDRLRVALATAANAASAQIAALTGERDQLQATLANANETARAQVAALTNAANEARAQVATLASERDQLRSALANANNAARTEVAGLTGEVNELQSALAILRRPDTRSIPFGAPAAPHGFVFANRNGGLVLVASQLPQVASDRTLELWLVPNTGAPQPAGLFRPSDAAGDTVHVSSLAVNPSQIKAVAVSNEPLQGSTAPTTTPFLLVPVGS